MFELTPFERGNNDLMKVGDSFNQLFRNFFGNNLSGFMDMAQSPFKVDIRETENAYLVEAELPGVDKDSVNVEFNNNYLTISAKREDKTENVTDNFVRRERHFGELKRSFYVDGIDEEKIEASFRDGMLRIALPKKVKGTKGRKININ